MDLEGPQESTRRSILQNIEVLSDRLEEQRAAIPYGESLLVLLSDAKALISSRSVEITQLDRVASGLFRIVTDSWDLESGPVGREILGLHGELRAYIAFLSS